MSNIPTECSTFDPIKVKEEPPDDVPFISSNKVDVIEIIDLDNFPSDDEGNPDFIQTKDPLPAHDCEEDVIIRHRPRHSSYTKLLCAVESDADDETTFGIPKDKSLLKPVDTEIEVINLFGRDVNELTISVA